ncbi:MAG: PBP1A family penicillin-binding protein [Rhizobiales bacterium]|nr:PBP1A family penicillin-binding protein [Hyphomicrobiales bacterium]
MNPAILPPKVQKKKRRKSLLLGFFGFLFTVGFFGFVAAASVVGIVFWQITQDLPNYEVLRRYEPPVMTRIHASDGSLIGEYARERRIFVPINAIPEQVRQAFLSAEDKNFYEHNGIDPAGIARAVAVAFKGGRLTGASTITQQVAKNFLLTNERSFERKIKEAILALKMEHAFDKDYILELYLNEIYMGGPQIHGVAAAGLYYFNRELRDLSLAQAAFLAGLPKGANNYHPIRKRDAAIIRRNYVLGRMLADGFITKEQHDEAAADPLDVSFRPLGTWLPGSEYFAEEVRKQLVDIYTDAGLYGGGLSVRTALDPVLQQMAKLALVEGLVRYDRRQGWRGVHASIDASGDWGATLAAVEAPENIDPWRLAVVLDVGRDVAELGLEPTRDPNGALMADRTTGRLRLQSAAWAKPPKSQGLAGLLKVGDVIFVRPVDGQQGNWELMQRPEVQGGMVVMDPHTGRVRALVGGFSFERNKDEFNRAVQARRQPGSSFKPFVYAAALDNGYTPSSIILDAPITIEQGNGQDDWKPENYSRNFGGPSTLRTGIELSRNLMTVRLARDVGMPIITDYARRFGIYDNLLPVLSMSLGAGETTLLRMTAGYAMLANGGKRIEPTLIDRIQDRRGRTVWRHDRRACGNCNFESWANQPEPELADARRQIVDPHTAYQMTLMLEGVVERGTGQRVKAVGKPLAGKTGTTNDEKDAWFVGFSPDLVVGVYIGFDTPRPMGKGETGGSISSPVFRDFMQLALANQPAIPFRSPPGVKMIRVNRKTGLRTSASDPDAILEAFKPEDEPADTYNEYFGTDSGGGNGVGGIWGAQPSFGAGRGLY